VLPAQVELTFKGVGTLTKQDKERGREQYWLEGIHRNVPDIERPETACVMLAVKSPPTSSEVGLGRGRGRECPWVLERVARREGGVRLDNSPSRTQGHTCNQC